MDYMNVTLQESLQMHDCETCILSAASKRNHGPFLAVPVFVPSAFVARARLVTKNMGIEISEFEVAEFCASLRYWVRTCISVNVSLTDEQLVQGALSNMR